MKRRYQTLLSEYLTLFPCVGIVGPRQCGKTTLLQTLDHPWQIFDLERAADLQAIARDPDLFLRLNTEHVALDEAQLLPEVFAALRVAVDENRSQKGRFVVTGSSSPNLVRAMSESLAGRIGIIELSPLMWSEIDESDVPLAAARMFDSSIDLDDIRHGLEPRGGLKKVHDYWFRGGYPEPWFDGTGRFRDVWMNQYVQTYLLRDVSRLFPGINQQRFQRFIQLLGGLSGTVLNYADVARALSVSQPTARDHFDIAHGAFVWRQIPSFQKNAVKRLVKHPKGFLRDSGLAHHLARIPDITALLGHPNMGFSFEGMVIEEIIRQLECLGKSFDYSYYRTAAGAEVDLVVEGDFGLVPVEIKHASAVNSRELRPINDFMSEFNCPRGYIINNDVQPRRMTEKILSIPFACL